MSADLHLPIPPPLSPPSSTIDAAILRSNADSAAAAAASIDSKESESPTTPTAEEHRIPVPTSPPPAPQKRRRVEYPVCKRRLDFFDAAHSKEVEDFFASRFAEIQSRRLLKRNCPCS